MRTIPAFATVALFIVWPAAALPEPTAHLSGTVTAGGKPLEGATVLVERAFPIKGPAYYCPGCYSDCDKSARTDDKGRWSITKLDDTLKFDLLVVAKSHVPQFTKVLTPGAIHDLTVDLLPRDTDAIPKEQVVRGRVLGPGGLPVSAAVVTPQEVVFVDGGGMGGTVEGLDPLAVTDEDGRFALTYFNKCASMDLIVSARGYATACFPGLISGGVSHDLNVIEGSTVTGTLTRSGEPVGGIEVTLVTQQRGVHQVCFDRQTIATKPSGRFEFFNVPPQGEYIISASTEQLKVGCVVPKSVRVDKDQAEIDAGELIVVRGVHVSGRVLPPEGGTLPRGAKFSLSSQLAWESMTVDLADDGDFRFPEVPTGEYSLSLHAPGVYVSHNNASADRLNENMLVGKIDGDIAGLQIETTTQKPPRLSFNNPDDLPEIGGVEGAGANSQDEPVGKAAAPPAAAKPDLALPELRGRAMSNDRPGRNGLIAIIGTNVTEKPLVWLDAHPDAGRWTRTDKEGRFSLNITGPAHDYSLFAMDDTGASCVSRVDAGAPDALLTLKPAALDGKEKSCRVMVTNSSGQPVAGAIIMPTSVQVGGRVQSWGDLYSTAARITDASGHATLLRSAAKPPPSERGGEASGFSLRIIAEGYAPLECKRADFGDTPTQCVLTPGAHLTGRIIGPDGPLSAAAVELRPVVVNGDPILSRLSTRTDEAGRFTFEHAPLGAALNLCIPGWGNTQGLVAGPIKIDPLTDGQVFDALDLRADMGHRITGRIITEPGVKLPAPAWVTLARDDGCLGWAMPVQEDGSFFFSGAPFGGVYRITVFADGLMVSMKNAAASRSWTNSLRGHFKSEHTDLRVLLEPKREIPPDDAAQPRGRPLRGIEAMGAQ